MEKTSLPFRGGCAFARQAFTGEWMDIKAYRGHLYAIERKNGGALLKLDAYLNTVSEIRGIGFARQIEIRNGTVAITARENGLWLIDAEKMEVLSHYHTVEFATGITLCAGYAFVSCRQYGVEIVDISDPRDPKYVGIIRTGEVQSACVSDGYLYCGIWGEMKTVIVDIRDLANPRIASSVELSGRGDGVVVKDGRLYCACGQHSRGIKNLADPSDPCFGTGNGLDVFDVSDPEKPELIKRISFGKGFSIGFDMWEPMICGDVILVNDSVLGIYAFDVRSLCEIAHVSFPDVDGNPDAVTGMTVLDGALYATSSLGGIHKIDVGGLKDYYLYDTVCLARTEKSRQNCDRLKTVFRGDFPVLNLDYSDGLVALACGNGGIKIVGADDFAIKAEIMPGSFCTDIKIFGDFVYSAEAESGLAIYRIGNGVLEEVSRLKFGSEPVSQLALSPTAEYAIICCGSKIVRAIDVRDKSHPETAYVRGYEQGQLYGDNISSHRLSDGSTVLFWHRDGLVLTNPENGLCGFRTTFYRMRVGFAGFGPGSGCDTDGKNVYYGLGGGIVILPEDAGICIDEIERLCPKAGLRGKFSIIGDRVIAVEKAKGIITVAKLKDGEIIDRLKTDDSVGRPVECGRRLLMPARYGGVLELCE